MYLRIYLYLFVQSLTRLKPNFTFVDLYILLGNKMHIKQKRVPQVTSNVNSKLRLTP